MPTGCCGSPLMRPIVSRATSKRASRNSTKWGAKFGTFSLSPPTIAVVIDFDGGGRFQCQLTDADPDNVKIGDRVSMTFRRLMTADGVHNYFWKARPLGGSE